MNNPIWVVICVMLGTTTVSLNNSMVNPAIPIFIDHFNLSTVLATWIIVIFMTAMGMTMPLTSYLAAKWNRKWIYIIGCSLFLIGSVIGAYAQSIEQLLISRGVQGIASGLMIPLSLAIIYSVYPKEKRGSITGLWGAAVMLAPAFGPLVGSLILTVYDWHGLFIFNLPISLITIMMALKILPSSDKKPVPTFDGIGYLLIALGLCAILVTTGRITTLSALSEPTVVAPFALGLMCLGGFVFKSLNTEDPLLNVRLFKTKGYRSSVVVATTQAIGMFETLFLLPLLIQVVLGYSPIFTGVVLLITALSASTFGQLGGKRLDKNAPNKLVSIGLLMTGLGTIGFGFVTKEVPFWIFGILAFIRGAGVGLSYIPITTAGINTLSEEMITQGAVMNNLSRRLCASMALLAGALWIELGTEPHHIQEGTGYASAISEVFIIVGVLCIAVIPLAWRFPANTIQKPDHTHLNTRSPVTTTRNHK